MNRLYVRLLLWFCFANLVTLLVTVFVTERIARHAYGSDPDWVQMAQQANNIYIEQGEAGLREWLAAQRHHGFEAALYEDERNLAGRHLPMPRLPREMLASSDNVEFHPRPGLRVIGQRVTGSDGVPRQLVAMRRPGPPFPPMQQVLAIQIGLSLLVIGVVGWWLARSIARPVAAVQDAARRFAGGELATRVAPRWSAASDEIGDLARDFDRMAARIEQLVASERSVLQDVSHELRSPLARLHLLIDLARRSPAPEAAQHFSRAEQEIVRLDRLIGDALALSRLEADLPGAERDPLSLVDLVADSIGEARLLADTRALQLQWQPAADGEVMVAGSAMLLARAIDNLLANAIKFSNEGGVIEVKLVSQGGLAELCVRDHGPGVPETEIESLFRPFFRGSNAMRAQGDGLGLTIVQRVMQAHGGSVSARNADGGGLAVRLSLPLLTGLIPDALPGAADQQRKT